MGKIFIVFYPVWN